jgi:hypothetical protein
MVSGYCVKCKKKNVVMKDVKMTKTAKGGFLARGTCPKCSCGMCRICGQADAEKMVKAGEAKKAY